MGRSQKKGPYIDEKLFIKVNRQTQVGTREPMKTWARRCTIIPASSQLFSQVSLP